MHTPQTEVILRHEDVELARVTLPPGEYIVGRDTGTDIRAETPLLSRQHARLTINFDHLLIEDLGSSNGTFVADKPITEGTRVYPNQTVRLGNVKVEIHRLRAPEDSAASLPPAQAAIRRLLPEEVLTDKRYAIGQQVARGGMGAILQARQNATKRNVAMKVMLEANEETDVTRFVEEAQVTAQLEHPNIVPVHELGVDEQGQLFYTMKFVRGITLKKVLELLAQGVPETQKKFPLPALLTIFQKACDAIAFAHSKGVIHRDLKPENLMLGDFGEVLVMDWGLAKVIGHPGGETVIGRSTVMSARTEKGDTSRTLSGTIMGTPAYMAPEQARGEVESLDARADIYSLGAILFEILHQRAPVSGSDAWAIVEKVKGGEIDWTRPKKPLPESLLAVCRKALALDRGQRYASVEDLQADITAYQNGFATSAERASWGRRAALAIKRNKTVSIATALVVLTGLGFGTQAVSEGRRAERALGDLRRQAPALRQLAESEAGFQHFDSALDKLDAALALDPAYLASYWRRAWLFIGMDRLADAAAAIRVAQQKDPAHGDLAAILPTIEKLAALPPNGRWPVESERQLYDHLVKVGASGETVALSAKLKLNARDNEKLVRQRLDAWLGKGKGGVRVERDGLLIVDLNGLAIATVEPLRGLRIDVLLLGYTDITSLEPLRGMQLVQLNLSSSKKIADLSPLHGMPLRSINLYTTNVTDLSPLRGAPLEEINCEALPIVDFSPLRDAPLQVVMMGRTAASDLAFLVNAPLKELYAHWTKIADLSPLRGKLLKKLDISQTNVSDLTPLRGAPIEELAIHLNTRLKDLSPLLDLPKLERLRVSTLGKLLEPLRKHPSLKYLAYDNEPYRPVAEFWADYDAQQKKGAPK